MKCISVPTSQEAMSRLDFDKCIDGDVIDLNITDEQYRSLVELGLIRLMNDLFDICIDEFEDEKIVGVDSLTQARLLIENDFHPSENEAVNLLLSQVNKATEYETGLFFYFDDHVFNAEIVKQQRWLWYAWEPRPASVLLLSGCR